MDFASLDNPYELTESQIDFYRANNFIKLKNVLEADCLAYYNDCISKIVMEYQKELPALENRSTYDKAFLQLFNLWRRTDEIKTLVFSKRLAKIASELMQCSGVRLYHDQALFKEPDGGITPWHADQQYWPFSNNNAITVWIPLHPIHLEMGPLEFSAGSHNIITGRNLEIGDNSEIEISKNLKVNDFSHIIEAYDLGEVSFHSGWIFHRAGANFSQEMRKVMTIIYMDETMKAIDPTNKNQANDLLNWCPGIEPGQTINSPLNPILFSNQFS